MRRSSVIGSALFAQGEQQGYGRAFTEVGVVLSRRPNTVLGPDAVFISTAKLPVVESPEGYLETIPDLAVEVRSRNDSAAELDRKIAALSWSGRASRLDRRSENQNNRRPSRRREAGIISANRKR